ncbi:MAG: leucyl-tRNA--protein transferase [Treponema sp.]|nr:leucyl-tRNA--protein transferase [Treponema sp.]
MDRDERVLRQEQIPLHNFRGLHFLPSGLVFILNKDDPDKVMDRITALGYPEESCYAVDFDPGFIARLMRAGFLIMSRQIKLDPDDPTLYFIVEPMHHLSRSFLFFNDLHEKRSARKKLDSYELRVDGLGRDHAPAGIGLGGSLTGDRDMFNTVIDKCVAIHGADWLTPPLVQAIKALRPSGLSGTSGAGQQVQPVSFGLYRDGALKAGEFGTVIGGIYTSYSGYHEEDDAGNAQLILTARYLRDAGFVFWDLGMPLPYKERLGARTLSITQFLPLWRSARRLF